MSGITDTPPSLEIRLFGPLTVVREGGVVGLPASRKTRALLAYLVATGRQHTRHRLAKLLWDDPADPRASLRWSLWKLRRVLADDVGERLVSDRERVEFRAAGVRVDLLELRAAVAPNVARAPTALLEGACARVRGELLEGLDLPDCYGYQSWCVAERESLRRLHVGVLSTLVARLREDEPDKALAYARSWVAADPVAEEAHAQVVCLLGELGRMREAIDQYDASRHMLQARSGAVPPELLERARASLPRATTAPAGAPPPPRSRPIRSSGTPLVGRSAERTAIARFVWSAVAGRCRKHLLVTGDPGIGKSRLLEELAGAVERAGGTVLRGRGWEAERLRPYGIWVDALATEGRGDDTRDRAASGFAHGAAGAATEDHSAERGLGRFDVLARRIARIEAQRPAAIVLDDVQWLDEPSVALLHFAVRTLGGGRLLFAFGARRGELEDNDPCREALRALLRDGRMAEVHLEPLDADATAQLVETVGEGIDAGRVFTESRGNPLFALEVARALRRAGVPRSGTLERLVADRLPVHDGASRAVISWLAAFGHPVSPARLAAVAQLPSEQIAAAIERLERLAILERSGPEGYDFVNDLVRRVAYRRIPAPRRRLLHLRIAEALAGISGSATTDGC